MPLPLVIYKLGMSVMRLTRKGTVCVVHFALPLCRAQRMSTSACSTFCDACKNNNVKMLHRCLQWEGSRRVDVHQNRAYGFRVACLRGHMGIVHTLLGLTGDRRINVHECNEDAFITACTAGRASVVTALLELTGDRAVDVHVGTELALRSACAHGRLRVVRILLSLSGERQIDVHARCEAAFRRACWGGHVGIVRELLALTGRRQVDVHLWMGDTFAHACRHGFVRMLLELDGGRAPSHEQQLHALAACAHNVKAWTRNRAAWSACPVRRRMQVLCPPLQEAVHQGARAMQWRHRCRLFMCRMHASTVVRSTAPPLHAQHHPSVACMHARADSAVRPATQQFPPTP